MSICSVASHLLPGVSTAREAVPRIRAQPNSCWCSFFASNMTQLLVLAGRIGIPAQKLETAVFQALLQLNEAQQSPVECEAPLSVSLFWTAYYGSASLAPEAETWRHAPS